MRVILATIWLVTGGAGWAQQPLAPQAGEQDPAVQEEEEERRRYSVELIIFEYADSVSAGGEVFVPEEAQAADSEEMAEIQLPDYRARLGAARLNEYSDLEEVNVHGAIELTLLERESFTLIEAYDRLQRLDAYEPLLHVGWVQTTTEPARTPAIQLRRLGDPPLRLDGELKLYLSRYLHLVVDLELDARAGTAAVANEQTPYFGDSRDRFDAFDRQRMPAPTVRYRISEDRIFKNGDLRYFDHPKFGVLVKIARYEPEDSLTPGETDEDVLAPGTAINRGW
jgi:hypothetical protein